MKELNRLIEAVQEFYLQEYLETCPDDDIVVDGIIGIAYTDLTDAAGVNHEIRVEIDVNNHCWLDVIDDEIVSRSHRNSLFEIAEELKKCDFMSVLVDVWGTACDRFGDEVINFGLNGRF